MQLIELTETLNDLYFNNSSSLNVINSKCKELLELINPKTDIKNIDIKIINKYIKTLRDKGNSNATINSKLAYLSKCLSYAQKNNLIMFKPHIPTFKVTSHKIKYITDAEQDLMLEYCNNNGLTTMKIILITGVNTGLRIRKILEGLHIEDNHIRIETDKNNRANSIPLNQNMLNLISEIGLDDINYYLSQTNYDKTEYIFSKMIRALNLEDITLHTLRHTFCSRLIQKDVPLTTIQRLANHKNYNTTLKYAHLSDDNLKQAVNVL